MSVNIQRIAIVEDEASLREDLVAFFKLRGLEVLGFESGEAFFRVWPHIAMDVVVLDIGLPGCSGIEVAEEIRKQSPLPVLMLTADASQQTHLSSLHAGADVFLCKSTSLEIIESTVRNMLARARLSATVKSPGSQRKSDQTIWRLFTQSMQLKAPNDLLCALTFSEFQFLSALMLQPNQTVARETLLKSMSKDATLSNLRNLDTYATRIRRKTQAAVMLEVPIRSAYNSGYVFSGQGYVLP